jgi:hypothetical protein
VRLQRGRKPENRAQSGQKCGKSAANSAAGIRHVNIHASTRALAGVLQTIPNSVEKLDLKHSAYWLCNEQIVFSISWLSF